MATKDLGIVTAYGYAVAGGYTGTEQEFTALLGNLALTVEDLENMTVSVTTLEPTEQATASYSDGVLSLGIPKGRNGEVTQDDLDAQLENYATNEDLYYAFPNGTATGSIASFSDGADNLPMKSLKVTIAPKQAGSGDPSPSNVRPITGTSTANVTVDGKNLFDKSDANNVINAYISGGVIRSSINHRTLFIPCKPNTTYTIQHSNPYTNRNLLCYTTETPAANVGVYPSSGATPTVTTGADAKYLVCYVWNSNVDGVSFDDVLNSTQIELGTTATAYEPYTGTTTPVPLGQTVYGATGDVVSGEWERTKVGIDMGSLDWIKSTSYKGFYAVFEGVKRPSWGGTVSAISSMYRATSFNEFDDLVDDYIFAGEPTSDTLYVRNPDYTDASAFKTAMAGQMIVYELATPTAFTTTPTEVRTLLGTNNVWSVGDVEVEYRADPTLAYNELANVIVSLGGNI